jgi:hypothetical protein
MWDIALGTFYDLAMYVNDPATVQVCFAADGATLQTTAGGDGTLDGGFVGLRTFRVTASWRFFIAYRLGGPITFFGTTP